MSPRRRKAGTEHLPDNLYKRGSSYRYRHPQTGQFFGMGQDEAMAIAAARKLNLKLKSKQDLIEAITGGVLMNEIIKRYADEYLPEKNIKASSRQQAEYRLNRISKDLGKWKASQYTIKALSEYLDDKFKGDPYIKYRGQLIDIEKWAISKGLLDDHVATKTLPKNNTTKKRRPLTLEQFYLIRANAPQWLKNAMDIALVTLQRRGDILKIKYTDHREGRLFVIQEKTEKHGVRAHLSIEVGEHLEKLINSTRSDNIASPFLIHTKPDKVRPSKEKEHWSQILPNHLTQKFGSIRDELEVFKKMPKAERPTFHEIRALGGALYLENGYSKEYVNLLMGHTKMEMTDHYTDRHIEWTDCRADLSI